MKWLLLGAQEGLLRLDQSPAERGELSAFAVPLMLTAPVGLTTYLDARRAAPENWSWLMGEKIIKALWLTACQVISLPFERLSDGLAL